MEITSSVVSDFRTYYPEFADDTAWPDPELTRALQAADDETGSTRWGQYAVDPASFKARGLFAYAAHAAVVNKAARQAVEAGGSQGPARPAQSKSVGDESVSYDPAPMDSAVRSEIQGGLRATVYGQEFLRLRRRAGTGAATTSAGRL